MVLLAWALPAGGASGSLLCAVRSARGLILWRSSCASCLCWVCIGVWKRDYSCVSRSLTRALGRVGLVGASCDGPAAPATDGQSSSLLLVGRWVFFFSPATRLLRLDFLEPTNMRFCYPESLCPRMMAFWFFFLFFHSPCLYLQQRIGTLGPVLITNSCQKSLQACPQSLGRPAVSSQALLHGRRPLWPGG